MVNKGSQVDSHGHDEKKKGFSDVSNHRILTESNVIRVRNRSKDGYLSDWNSWSVWKHCRTLIWGERWQLLSISWCDFVPGWHDYYKSLNDYTTALKIIQIMFNFTHSRIPILSNFLFRKIEGMIIRNGSKRLENRYSRRWISRLTWCCQEHYG